MVCKVVKKSMVLLLAGSLLGTLLLTLAYMLPVNSEHKAASAEILDSEGWYPRAMVTALSLDAYFHSYLPDVLDDSTDKIMLYTAMDTGGENPLVRAMKSHSEYMGDYSYYWHGYVSILRPLLLLFDYSEIRMLNGFCQWILMLLLAFFIGREKGIGYVMMLGSSYLLLNPSAMALSLQYTWVFYIAFLSVLALVVKREFLTAGFRYVYFFIAIGMLTSYFDLLTYPLCTWGIPVIWWLALDKETGMSRQKEGKFTGAPLLAGDRLGKSHYIWGYLRRVFFSGIAWIVGYAVMWMMKWAIGTLVLGQNVFKSAFYRALLRLGAQEEGNYGVGDRLKAVYSNWMHYEYKVYAMLLVCWLICWLWRSLRRGYEKSPRRYAYLLAGVSSVVWCLVFANHTQGHHFFTYRIMGVGILAFFAMVLDSTGAGDEAVLPKSHVKPWTADRESRMKVSAVDRASHVKVSAADRASHMKGSTVNSGNYVRPLAMNGVWKVLGGWGAAALLAVPSVLFAREEIVALNGYAAFTTLQIPQEAVVEMDFSPAFSEILGVNFGLECSEGAGEWELTLWDGDTPLERKRISFAEEAGYYRSADVHWKLDTKKSYRITMQAFGNEAPVSIWVTESGAAPLTEYQGLAVNGSPVEGQILSGLHYRALPRSKKTLLFLFLTWTGIWMALIYAFGASWLEGHKDRKE